MINNISLTGRITRDLELRKTQSGTSVVSFTLAVNRRFKQEGQPEADFINCVAWSGTADFMSKYLAKGSLIGVEGRIQTRNYEDKQGNKVFVTEVVAENVSFLESKKERENNDIPSSNNNFYDEVEDKVLFDDSDLPF